MTKEFQYTIFVFNSVSKFSHVYAVSSNQPNQLYIVRHIPSNDGYISFKIINFMFDDNYSLTEANIIHSIIDYDYHVVS